jgi:hypothetical protein
MQSLASRDSPMRGPQAWRRTLKIRERYLSAGDPDRLLVRSMSCDITLDDLPGGYHGAARGGRRGGLERAERQALLTALRDAGWDREAAARPGHLPVDHLPETEAARHRPPPVDPRQAIQEGT